MRRYLVCYWVERNDVATDLEEIVEADNIKEALDTFLDNTVCRKVTSISELINFNFIP